MKAHICAQPAFQTRGLGQIRLIQGSGLRGPLVNKIQGEQDPGRGAGERDEGDVFNLRTKDVAIFVTSDAKRGGGQFWCGGCPLWVGLSRTPRATPHCELDQEPRWQRRWPGQHLTDCPSAREISSTHPPQHPHKGKNLSYFGLLFSPPPPPPLPSSRLVLFFTNNKGTFTTTQSA